MPTLCRAVLGGTVLLTAALALAACTGQGMAESSARANAARYAAQGNPQFADPALQAVVKAFEARFAEIGLDAEKLGMAQGRPCPVTQETAFQVLRGMSYEQYLDTQADVARQVPGYTGTTDLKAVQLVSLAGVCGENGPEGQAVVAGTTRDIVRYSGDGYSNVMVSDSVQRIEATWAGGQRSGSFTWIIITQTAQFKPGESGALEADINDWDFINEMREAPTGTYVYSVADDAGKPKYTVSFARNPVVGIYSTTVVEQLDEARSYSRTWQGTELRQEGPTKNGKLHGWQVTHPTVYDGTPVPGQRNCYQDGALVKTLECPST
jgi:hypothetical protein